MKILIIAALFPPNIVGGAEISAFNNASYHRDQGHEIGVLTTAKSENDILNGDDVNGMRIWRVLMPRTYSPLDYANQPVWKKILWHLQDHFDPRNKRIAAQVLETFKPDYIYIHIPQGLGWNILSEVARRNIPATYFLHDLSLACYRTSMYRGDKECTSQCAVCKMSCSYKKKLLCQIKALKFISPSKANLERVARFIPIKDYPNAHILNPNTYPKATVERTESEHIRFLYVGRLDSLKGVDLLLSVADELARKYKFTLTLVGAGRDEEKYRQQYETKEWCRFAGFVSREEVSNYMASTDILCVPSVWFENSPGAAIQALSLGIPVMGSNYGGIGELVDHGKNGLLIEAGNHEAWKEALESILINPDRLKAWSNYALAHADKFDAKANGKRIFEFSQEKMP